MRIILSENEKSEISSQHDEIDRKLLIFLMRRIKIEKRKLGGNWGDIEPLEVTEYTFEGHPSYGFTSYDSKKTMENKIIRMLFENDIIEDVYDMDERDPERVKIVKTVRNFLNFILKDKK
jgi:hypothetical protein